MDRYQEIVDRLSVVRGFMKPVMIDDPIPGRDRRAGLNPEDFARVAAGYGCPNADCRAWWSDERRLKCPACGYEQSESDFLDRVKEWDDYERDLQNALENPIRTHIPSMAEVIDATADEVLEGWTPGVRRNL